MENSNINSIHASDSSISEDNERHHDVENDNVSSETVPVDEQDFWTDDEARVEVEKLTPVLLNLRTGHTSSALQLGQHLVEIKEKWIKHKYFVKWLEDFEAKQGVNIRSSQRYMKPAKAFKGFLDVVSVLSLTHLGKLSDRSVPQEVRDAVVDKLKNGETPREVVAYLKEVKPELFAKKAPANPEEKTDGNDGVGTVFPEDIIDNMAEIIRSHLDDEDQFKDLIDRHGFKPLVEQIVRKLTAGL